MFFVTPSALVYEFSGNGNLEEWLHPTPRTNNAIKEPRKLSLLQRLKIAIDLASALDYFHHHYETPIVHYDLKPSNVLLDDDLIEHVGNFGLARFLHDISQSSSIGIRGTVGYTPPGKYILHFLNLIFFLSPIVFFLLLINSSMK